MDQENTQCRIIKLRWWGGLGLGFLLFVVCLTPLKQFILDSSFWVGLLQHKGCSVCVFIGAYVILTVLGLPGTILTVTGGVVFGLWWGTVWSVLGATLGAIAAFFTARYFLRDWISRKFAQNPHLKRFEQAVNQMPLHFVLAVRFAPISPFNVVNFLFGLTPISPSIYAAGTLVGIVPGTLAYTWLGVTGKTALNQGNFLPLFAALCVLSGLSLMPILTQRFRQS